MAQPTITSVTPNFGSNLGGTYITINGTNFLVNPTITVWGLPATNINWVSASQVICVTPAGNVGAADVVLTNTDTTTVTYSAGYTYILPSVYHQLADVAGKYKNITFPYTIASGNSSLLVTASQAQVYINQTEAKVNLMLLHKGYVLPITAATSPYSFPVIQKMCVAFTANDIYQIYKSSSVKELSHDDAAKAANFWTEGNDIYNKILNDELILSDVTRNGNMIQHSTGVGLENDFLVYPPQGGPNVLPFNPTQYPYFPRW